MHHCRYISIDIFIQRYLQHCEINIIDNKNLNKVKWSRDDYFIDDGDKGCWLMSSQWKVRPTIAFIGGTMKVLTFKDHDVRVCTYDDPCMTLEAPFTF